MCVTLLVLCAVIQVQVDTIQAFSLWATLHILKGDYLAMLPSVPVNICNSAAR